MWFNTLSMPMAMVTIEDEGGHPNIERADYNNERFEGAESKGATSKSYGSRMFAEFQEKKMETNTC